MPRLTIVTAARDAAAFLPETIASVQAQAFTDWRYVIVDDASTDATSAVAHDAASSDPRIEVRTLRSSVGSYAAANPPMLESDSEYLARIDADDVATPHRFTAQLAALARTPNARACTGAWQALTEGIISPRVRQPPTTSNGVMKWIMWMRNTLVHSTLMISTDAFRARGGYGPEPVGMDYRLWASLVRSDELAFAPETLVYYRFTSGQVTAESGARDQPARHEATREHIAACAPGDWSVDDARDYRDIGRVATLPVARALSLIDRWERAWRRDATLIASDRNELRGLGANLRMSHVRLACKRDVSGTISGAPKLLRAAALVSTGRGKSWTT